MKLLLDQNLSYRLAERLQESFPGSTQVGLVGLERASDQEIWAYARDNGYVVVTKDSDFHEYSVLYGPPPKVVWLKTGNTTTASIADRLLTHADELASALARDEVYYVEVY